MTIGILIILFMRWFSFNAMTDCSTVYSVQVKGRTMSNISDTLSAVKLISPGYPNYTDSTTEVSCIITPISGETFKMTTVDAWITSKSNTSKDNESYLKITGQTSSDVFTSIYYGSRFQRHFEYKEMTETELQGLRISYFSKPGELKFILKLRR